MLQNVITTGSNNSILATLKKPSNQYPKAEEGTQMYIHIDKFKIGSGFQVWSSSPVFHKSFQDVHELNELFDFEVND